MITNTAGTVFLPCCAFYGAIFLYQLKMLVVFAGEPVTTLEAILGEELEAKTIAVNYVRP